MIIIIKKRLETKEYLTSKFVFIYLYICFFNYFRFPDHLDCFVTKSDSLPTVMTSLCP